MRHLFKILLFTSTFAFSQQEIIIKNINVISMVDNSVVKNSVHVKNGVINGIKNFNKIKVSKKALIINGENKYLIPGMADMHVHLPQINQLDSVINYNLKAGVTRLRVMNSEAPQPQVKTHLETIKLKPQLYYSALVKRNVKYTDTQIDSLFADIKKNNTNFIKVLSLPNEEVFFKILAKATENKVIVCGHYPMYVQFGKGVKIDIDKVLATNYKSIEHLGGYDGLKDQALTNAISSTVKNKIFNCPTADYDAVAYDFLNKEQLQNRYTYKKFSNQFGTFWNKKYNDYVVQNGGIDKLTETAKKYQTYIETKRNILKQLSDNNALLLLGSDPSNFYQLPGYNVYEEMLLWQSVGIDNFKILQASTTNAAQFFNEDKQWGTIEVGKQADLNILSANPLQDIKNITTVEKTILNGKILE